MENSTTIKSDTEYSEIIYKPSIRKAIQRDVETIIANEDQEFLSKLQILLNKNTTTAVKAEDMGSMQQMNMTTTSPPVLKTPHKPTAIKPNNPNAPDSTNLKNFFQNLLNKNAPSSTTASNTAPQSEQTGLYFIKIISLFLFIIE